MARVTVEDCLKQVPNRFLLVHVATKRARQLMKGSPLVIKGYHNRDIVMALREVAAGNIAVSKKAKAIKGPEKEKIKTIELKPENFVKEGVVLPTEESLLEEGISIIEDVDEAAEPDLSS
jgi:DNA-directed RNA polymerase subunit omega